MMAMNASDTEVQDIMEVFSDMFLGSQRHSICAQDSRLVCNLTREDVESVGGVETCMFCLVASVQDFFAA